MEDERPEEGNFGNWLHFVSQKDAPIRISEIRVDPWDGILPGRVIEQSQAGPEP